MRSNVVRTTMTSVVLAAAVMAACSAQSGDQLPPLQRRATPQAVVAEHLDALNKCDFTRLMAQYPDDVEIFLPGGEVAKGRPAVAELFRGFVKPVAEGGLCGVTFTVEHQQVVDGTVNAMWRATAPFLVEDYLGADAYVTKDGLLQAQVTTFDGAQLRFKK
jgi:hypothetical protein